jgi:3-methyladenine DNA glycosylase/8-oxoguanine DNA glycosylase
MTNQTTTPAVQITTLRQTETRRRIVQRGRETALMITLVRDLQTMQRRESRRRGEHITHVEIAESVIARRPRLDKSTTDVLRELGTLLDTESPQLLDEELDELWRAVVR